MKLSIGSTNYSVSYELNKIVHVAAQKLSERLSAEIEKGDLFRRINLSYLDIHFDLHGQGKAGVFFPDAYPASLDTRHLVKKGEYLATCPVDWSDWHPRRRAQAGLSKWPTEEEVEERLEDYCRVILCHASIVLEGDIERARTILGNEPAIRLGSILKAARRTRSKAPAIPLEVTFPLDYERGPIRDLLENTIVASGLGQLDGWSSGSTGHEVGLIVSDATAATDALKHALRASSLDPDLFQFVADD